MVEHADEEPAGRTTAPQSDYTARQIGIGAVVAAVGLLITFGVPLLMTL